MENYEGFYFTVVAATQSMSPEVADVLGCNIRPQLVVNLLTLQLHLFRIQLSESVIPFRTPVPSLTYETYILFDGSINMVGESFHFHGRIRMEVASVCKTFVI